MKTPFCQVLRIALSVAFVLSAIQVQAVVIVGNSTPDDFLYTDIRDNSLRAAGFTMPGQDYTLTNVVLRLREYDSGDANISIYSDSSGMPGSVLATLTDPAGGPTADYTFLPPAGPPLVLSANTSYWLVVAAEAGDFFRWVRASDSPTGVAAFDGYAQNNNGTGWVNFTAVSNLRFTINGEPVTSSVPDHGSTMMLLGMALLILALVSRRPGLYCAKR